MVNTVFLEVLIQSMLIRFVENGRNSNSGETAPKALRLVSPGQPPGATALGTRPKKLMHSPMSTVHSPKARGLATAEVVEWD